MIGGKCQLSLVGRLDKVNLQRCDDGYTACAESCDKVAVHRVFIDVYSELVHNSRSVPVQFFKIRGLPCFGFQIGASNTDIVMLVMNDKGMRRLLEDKFTLGAEATVAAGPVGRQTAASTDAQLSAEILSWSRSQGLFAGLALEGATLRQDLDDNATLYGKKMENRDIVTNGMRAPKAAARLMVLLNRYSARERRTD